MSTQDISLQAGVRTVQKPFWNRRTRAWVGHTFVYLFMVALAAVVLIPFFWLVASSLKSVIQQYTFPPTWIPKPIVWKNYTDLFTVLPFALFVKNTAVLIFWNIIADVLSNSAVAYGFARMRFRGREFWFIVLLATMMIPGAVQMVPRFILFKLLGWYDTYLPLLVPSFFAGPFSVFLLRQYMMTIPYELDEAARMDGANRFQIWYKILLPLCTPALTIIVVGSFNGAWNIFMDAIIYLNDWKKMPVQVGLTMLRSTSLSGSGTNWGLIMAGSFLTMLPSLIIYYFAQEKLIGGIASVALKG
ncbi:MAG: carbohydrate ABC transporter permease [Anaerolineae bacterium]|nr:carbohydrate ABC transporter permease [Anaerolineae bacterium]